MVKPVTVHDVVAVVQVLLPGVEVTVYPVIADSPTRLGTVQLTTEDAFATEPPTLLGSLGFAKHSTLAVPTLLALLSHSVMYESVPQYSSVSLEVDLSKAPAVEKVPFTVVVGVLPNESLVKAAKEPICHSMFCFGVPPSAQNCNVVSGAVPRKPILNFSKLQGSDSVVMLLAKNIFEP